MAIKTRASKEMETFVKAFKKVTVVSKRKCKRDNQNTTDQMW